MLQRFGTGGSPSADVSGIGAQKFSLTTSWQRFTANVTLPSIAGKTLGTVGDCLELTFWFDAGSSFNARTASLGQQSGTFDIADVMVEKGTVATDFERLPPAMVRALCNRYARELYVTAVASGFVQDYSFEQMRAAPTVSVVTSAWTGSPSFTATAANSLRQGTYASGAGAGTLLLTSEL